MKVKKEKKLLIKTPFSYQPTKIFRRVLNRINKSIALKNIKNNPQLIIFSFDHIGLSVNLDGRYENSELILLEKFINEKMSSSQKDTALDIGANIGNHSIFLSKFFNQVYSFEPNPITYDVLLLNSKYAAPKKNIIPYNIGLSNNDDKLPFKINPANIGGSRIVSLDVDKKYINIFIQVKKADEINSLQKKNVSLIKIDVEGHEIDVLKGAENIIKLNKPVIIFEQDADKIHNSSSEAIEYLSALNYSFYTIQESFYFGEKIIFRLFGVVLRSIFGECLSFVETTRFDKRSYNMILAIQKEVGRIKFS
jgi:FkbM family methyltransferase